MKKQVTKKILVFIRVFMTAAPLSLLCSCACTMNERQAKVAHEHGISIEKLPLINGKWHNTPKRYNEYASEMITLWEHLARKKGPQDAVVALEISGKRTLTATLLVDGVKTDSRNIWYSQCMSWLDLPRQYTAYPALWYVIWGLNQHDISIGIDANGDLCVITMYRGGIMMITIVPTPIGGGGSGGAHEFFFSRAE